MNNSAPNGKPALDLSYRPEGYFGAIDQDTYGTAALGHLHPSLMGGEYLPKRRGAEVEIAYIQIDSITSDVTSVLVRAGMNRLYYRVVDEYGGETLSAKCTRTSKRPLSLGELVDFFLTAWPLGDVLALNGLDRQGAQDFTHASSDFYPQFSAAISARIDDWYRPLDDDELSETDESDPA